MFVCVCVCMCACACVFSRRVAHQQADTGAGARHIAAGSPAAHALLLWRAKNIRRAGGVVPASCASRGCPPQQPAAQDPPAGCSLARTERWAGPGRRCHDCPPASLPPGWAHEASPPLPPSTSSGTLPRTFLAQHVLLAALCAARECQGLALVAAARLTLPILKLRPCSHRPHYRFKIVVGIPWIVDAVVEGQCNPPVIAPGLGGRGAG